MSRTQGLHSESYEIEKIIAFRIIGGKRHYLIKWKDYSPNFNTWEPLDNLLAISDDLLAFER